MALVVGVDCREAIGERADEIEIRVPSGDEPLPKKAAVSAIVVCGITFRSDKAERLDAPMGKSFVLAPVDGAGVGVGVGVGTGVGVGAGVGV